MELEDLVLAIRSGERLAWTRLVRVLYPELHRFFRRAFDDEHASDLAQECLLVVSDKLPQYRVELAPFRAWVHGIAKIELRRALRQQRRAAALDDELELAVPIKQPRLSSILLQCERFGFLADELRKLPDHHRRVIEHELADGNARELAEREGVGHRYARVLQQRARGQLAKRIRARAKTPLPRLSAPASS